MSTSKAPLKALLGAFLAFVFVVGGVFSFSPAARADAVIFLTRLNQVIATYPANNAFNVGSSTPQGGAAKLGVSLNVTDTYKKAFEIASTTGTGTATTSAAIFLVKNTGCVQAVATSSATPIALQFSTAGATSTFKGTVFWNYGLCP